MVRHIEELFDFLTDLYFQGLFSNEGLQDECQIILREADGNLQNEYRCAGHLLRRALFEKSPLARCSDSEEREQVVSITRDDLLTVRQQWHTPNNTVLLGVGALSHHQFCRLADELVSIHAEHAHQPILIHDDEYDSLPQVKTQVMPWPNRRLVSTLYGCKYPRSNADRDFILRRYVQDFE